MERTPQSRTKILPLDRPDVVRTVPTGTALRIGDSVVLALPYPGRSVRYLVWSRLDIGIAKLDVEGDNTRGDDLTA